MDDLFSSKETQEQVPVSVTGSFETPETTGTADISTPAPDPVTDPVTPEIPKEQSVPLIPGVALNKPTSYPPILGIPSQEKPSMIDPETFKYERSLSTLGYLLVLIVMQIPILGLILTIVWACSAKRKSLRSLSRAMIIIWVLMIALAVAAYLFVSTHQVLVNHWITTFSNFFRFLK